jgi:hypothetical protein
MQISQMEKFTINTYINTLWDYFKTKCTDITEECIPSKTTSTRITQPWITKDLRTLSRYILRFTGKCLDIAMLESTKTISWSLMPGIASHLLINDGRFVKNTSSRFWPLSHNYHTKLTSMSY